MVLYGSQTSPFVRRIRLLLPEDSYRFKKVDIFNPTERKELFNLSPSLKIPILVIEQQPIWDSRIIFNELCRRGYHRNLTIDEENLLTAISDLSDSLIQNLLAQRSNVIFAKGTPIETSHSDRITNTLTYLNEQLYTRSFNEWSFLSMSLFAMVDWVEFRALTSLTPYGMLKQFHKANLDQPRVALTDPRAN
ncbi:MAG: hypothetical protein RJB66_1237 [Pseudomonadota bacterium]|jgi:glutathione S-transferase